MEMFHPKDGSTATKSTFSSKKLEKQFLKHDYGNKRIIRSRHLHSISDVTET